MISRASHRDSGGMLYYSEVSQLLNWWAEDSAYPASPYQTCANWCTHFTSCTIKVTGLESQWLPPHTSQHWNWMWTLDYREFSTLKMLPSGSPRRKWYTPYHFLVVCLFSWTWGRLQCWVSHPLSGEPVLQYHPLSHVLAFLGDSGGLQSVTHSCWLPPSLPVWSLEFLSETSPRDSGLWGLQALHTCLGKNEKLS